MGLCGEAQVEGQRENLLYRLRCVQCQPPLMQAIDVAGAALANIFASRYNSFHVDHRLSHQQGRYSKVAMPGTPHLVMSFILPRVSGTSALGIWAIVLHLASVRTIQTFKCVHM